MRSEDYQTLNTMVEEFRREVSEINIQIENNLRNIKTADAQLKSFTDSEEESFRLFSPRRMEAEDRRRMEKIAGEKVEYEDFNKELEAKKKVLTDYADKIDNIIKRQTIDNISTIENLKNSCTEVLQKLEGLIQRIEISSEYIEKNPLQAKQDFIIIKKYLQEIVVKMKGIL